MLFDFDWDERVQKDSSQISPGKSKKNQRQEFIDTVPIGQVGVFNVKTACFQCFKCRFSLPSFFV